ncbi:putative protein kinase RLK-Pelle-CrRLK1L-1 family [Helianthus annuus]|nr:putative protein kinase RLK-Pelle-CrRLK1L-1 family [Helianthus annuus]
MCGACPTLRSETNKQKKSPLLNTVGHPILIPTAISLKNFVQRYSNHCVFVMETRMSSLPYAHLCHPFSLDEILSATQNFDDALVVGKGGFGKVYKALINVENGATVIVAIKRLDTSSNQGEPEFWAEVEMLTKLRHCNLVSLIGYCNDNSEMILIYEFMPHGTLHDHLHRYGTRLSWVHRLKISIGAARGLHYLHTGTGIQHGVIHRDVKSTNILLDENYAAKISDFGLSKIGPTNASGAYVNTLVRGTFGYLDPEYFLTGRLTTKSDVFAFGVVLFELLCGRAALDNSLDEDKCSLAKWAHESIEKGKVNEITDFNIKSQISPKSLKVFVQIADRSLSSESKKRPTMAEILVALELSLTLQNKFDRRISVKPAVGILSIARMIKWPFISHELNSAQSDRNLCTVNEDTNEHTLSSKEDSVNHHEVATSEKMLDRLYSFPQAPNNSPEKEFSDGHLEVSSAGKIQILAHDLKSKFSFEDLKIATRDFTHEQYLGGGEFGEVFEGWMKIPPSAVEVVLRVAIKRFYHSKIQHHLKEKFLDTTFLSKFNDHPNLVKVLGYCFEDEQLFLVYECMENGSLDSHLFTKDKMPLSWKTRIQIALGVAQALLFLWTTQNQVDNFSIKLHQILLDQNFNAKLSDFESAKLAYGDLYKEKVYVDPLYYYNRPKKSEFKGIVHSFGVVLFQILTGERYDYEFGKANLLRSMSNQKESMRRELDPRLPSVDDTTIIEAMKLASVARRCVEHPYNYYTMIDALNVLRQLCYTYE